MALTLLIAAACLVGTSAVPTPKIHSCASTCTTTNNHKFEYETGKTYTYDYETTMQTSLAGRYKDFWNLQVSAKAQISSLNSCNLILKLNNVHVTQTDSNDNDKISAKAGDLKRALERNTLVFAFQDGRIDSVCSSNDDPVWVVNFKRGLLSAFQNTMPDLERDHRMSETDISGLCPTNYVIKHYKWASRTIRKTKDLSKCTQRNAHSNIGLQLFPHFPSSSESLPIFNTDYSCDQEISNDKILQSVTCREKYAFNPFSANPDAGVVTRAVQKLTLSRVRSGGLPSSMDRTHQSPLLFQHETKGMPIQDYSQKATDILRQLVSSDNIQLRTPMLFKSLVTNLRHLDEELLRLLYTSIPSDFPDNTKLATKYFVDALQMAMTTASVELMKQLIVDEHVSDIVKNSWLLSLAFIPNPKKEFIISLSPLLDNLPPGQKVLLGLSALINNYCQQKEARCDTDEDILSIVDKFTNLVPRDCRVKDKKNIEELIVTLKAIGNIGYGKSTTPVLQHCIIHPEIQTEIRVAAIEAIRRSSCDEMHDSLLGLLSNHEENVELRIAAYLSLMRCPSEDTIKKVKRILDVEDVNQVGSFIWTHLINIQNTEYPAKRHIKSIVQNHILKHKFSTDALKFSRAYEKSFYSKSLETGVHGEANVVFAPESHFPRSLTTNLTIELFGRPINLLEVGGRVEGLESWVERPEPWLEGLQPWVQTFFGPNGYFPQSGDLKSSVIDEEKLNKIEEKVDARGRLPDPTFSAYLRIFGNELHYYRSNEQPKSFESFLHWLLNEEETSLTQSLTFVDTTLIIPTLTGFPLNLTVNGSAVIQLKMKGHTQINSLLNLDCDIDGYIKPSAAIQLSSSLSTNLDELNFGMRLDTSAHSSSSVSGKISLKGGQLVSVHLDAPEDKMDVINFNTQLFLVDDESEIPLSETVGNRVEIQGCSGSLTDRILGVEVCGGLSYPNASGIDHAPGFPLTGPASVHLFVRKTDRSLTSYNFDYQWQDIQSKSGHVTKTRSISIDTPGSIINRKWSAEFILNQSDNAVIAELKTPFKTLGARAKYTNEDLHKKIYASLSVDDVDQITFDAELRKEIDGDIIKYTPYLNLQFPWIRPVNLKGQVMHQKGGKVAVDLILEHLTIRPISLTGDLTLNPNHYEMDLTFKSFLLTTRLKSRVQIGPNDYLVFVGTDWSLMETIIRHYETTIKFHEETVTRGSRRLSGSGEIIGSALGPLSVKWEYQRKKDHVENQVEFSVDSKTFTTRQSFSTQVTKSGGNICIVELSASCPSTKFDWAMIGKHARDSQSTNTKLAIRQGSEKVIDLNLKTRLVLDPLLDAGFEVGAIWPGENVKIVTQVKKINPHEYEGDVLVQLSPEERHTFRGKYQDYGTPGKKRQILSFELKNPKQPASTFISELNSGNDYLANTVIHHNDKKYSFLAQYDPKAEDEHKLKTALSWAGDDYAADASVTFKPETSRMLMDVRRSGGKRIQGGLEFVKKDNRTEAEFSLKLDADNNPQKELIIRGTYEKLENGRQIHFATSGDYGHYQVDILIQSDGSFWSPTYSHRTRVVLISNGDRFGGSVDLQNRRLQRAMDGRVTIVIYHPKDDIKIESEYNFVPDGWTVSGSYVIGDSKRYRISSICKVNSWSRGHVSFHSNIRVDIPRSEPIIFAIEHLRTDKDLLSSVKIPMHFYGVKPLNLTIRGSKHFVPENHRYFGEASAFLGDSLIYSVSAEHELTGPKCKAKLTLKSKTKSATLEVLGESLSGPGRSGYSASFTLKSPLMYLEDTRGYFEYSVNNSALNSKNQIFGSGEELVSLEITLNKPKEKGSFIWEGSMHLNTKYKHLQNIHLIVKHQEKHDRVNQFIDLQLSQTLRTTLTVDARMSARNDFDINIKLDVPHLESPITLQIKHYLADRLDTLVQLKDEKRTVGWSLSGYINKGVVKGTLRLNLPLHRTPVVNMHFNYVKDGKDVLIEFEIEDSLKIESKGTFTNYYNFDNTFKIFPVGYKMPNIELTISQTIEPRLKHSTSLIYGTKKYSLEFENIKNDKSSVSYRFLILTPFAAYGPYIVDALYKSDRQSREFNLSLEYSPGNKIGLGTSLNTGGREGKIGIDILTPIKGLEKICLSATYSLANNVPQVDVLGTWGESGFLKLTSMGKWIDGRGKAEFSLRLWEKHYQDMNGLVLLDIGGFTRRNSLTVELRGSYDYGVLNIVVDKANSLEAVLESSSPQWNHLSLKIKCGVIQEGKTIKLQLQYNDVKYEAYGVIGPQYFFARVQMPLERFYLLSIEAKSRVSENEISASVEVQVDSAFMETRAVYRSISRSGGEVTWTLSIPSEDQSLGITGNYHLTQDEVSGFASLIHNKNKIEINGKLSNDNKSKILLLSLTSPLKNFENVEIMAKYYNPNPLHRVASATWKQGDVEIGVLAKFILEDETGVIELVFYPRYHEYPMFLVSAKRDFSQPTKKVTFNLLLASTKAELECTCTTKNTRRQGYIKLVSNFNGPENTFVASYDYDLAAPQKKVVIKLSKNDQALDIKGTYEANTKRHPGSFVVSIEDGLSGQHYYALNVNYDTQSRVKVIDATVHFGSHYNDLELKWSSDEKTFDFSTRLSVPQLIHQPYVAVSGSIYTRDNNRHDLVLKIELGKEVTELSGFLNQFSDSGDFEVSVTSQYQHLSNLRITGNYDLSSTEKTFWLLLQDGKSAEIRGRWQQQEKIGNAELTVTATRDDGETRRVAIRTNYDFTKTKHLAEVAIDVLQQQYTVKIESLQDRLKGNYILTIATPIDGYNSLGAEIHYNLDRAKTTAMAFVQWADGKRISLNLDVSIVDVTGRLVIETPFENWKLLDIQLVPNLNAEKKNVALSIHSETRSELRLTLEWVNLRTAADITFKVESNVPEFSYIDMNFSYNTRTHNHIEFSVSWPGRNWNKLTASFNNVGREMLDVQWSLQPVEGHDDVHQIKLKYDVRRWDLSMGLISVQNGPEKLEFSINCNAYDKFSISLVTPVEEYRSISTNVTLNREKKQLTINSNWNDHHVDILLIANKQPKNIDISGQITTSSYRLTILKAAFSLDSSKSVGTTVYFIAQGNENIAKLEIDTAQRTKDTKDNKHLLEASVETRNLGKISLTLDVDIADKSLTSVLKLTTLFKDCEFSQVKFDYSIHSSQLSSSLTIDVCSDNIFKLNTFVDVQRVKKSINVQWQYYQRATGSLDASYDLTKEGDNAHMTLQWHQSTIEAHGRIEQTENDIHAKFTVGSSFTESDIIVVGKYDGSGDSKKFTIDVTYDEDEKIHVAGEIGIEGNVCTGGNINIRTPYYNNGKDVGLGINYRQTPNEHYVALLFQWGSEDYQKTGLKFLAKPEWLNLQLILPFKTVKHFEADVKYRNNDFLANVTLNHRNILLVSLTGAIELPRLINLNAKVQLLDYQAIELLVNHKIQDGSMSSLLVLNMERKLFEVHAQYKKNKADGLHEGIVTIECGDRKITVSSSWQPHAGRLVLESSDRSTPWFELIYDFKYEQKPQELFVDLKLPNTQYRLQAIIDKRDNSLKTTGDIEAVHTNSKLISFEFSGMYDRGKSFKLEVKVKVNEQVHALYVDFERHPKTIKGIVKINCPLISSQEVTINVDAVTTPDNIEINLSISPNHKFKIILRRGEKTEVRIHLDTSWVSWKTLAAGYQHQSNRIQTFASLSTASNFYEISINATQDYNEDGEHHMVIDAGLKTFHSEHYLSIDITRKADVINVELELLSPLLGDKPVNFKAKLKPRRFRRMSADVSAQIGKTKLIAISTYSNRKEKETVSKIEISTDLFNIKNVSAEFKTNTEEGTEWKLTVGRLNTFHSLGVRIIQSHSTREVAVRLSFFNDSPQEKSVRVSLMMSPDNSILLVEYYANHRLMLNSSTTVTKFGGSFGLEQTFVAPVFNIELITINAELTATAKSKSIALKYSSMGTVHEVNILLQKTRQANVLQLKADSPLIPKRIVELELKSSIIKHGMKFYGNLAAAGSVITLNMDTTDDRRRLKTAEIILDSTEFKTIKISGKLDHSSRDVVIASVQGFYGQNKIELQSSTALNEKMLTGKLEFARTTTSFIGEISDKQGIKTAQITIDSTEFKTIKISGKLDQSSRDAVIASIQGSYGRNKIELQSSNSYNEKKITGKLEFAGTVTTLIGEITDDKRGIKTAQITVDSSEFETVKFVVKLDRSASDVVLGSIHGSYGRDKIEGRFQNDDSGSINGRIAVKSPTDRTKRLRLNFGYSKALLNRTLSIRLKSGNPKIGDWGTDITWTPVKNNPGVSVTVYTPYKKCDWIRIDFNFKYNDDHINVMSEIGLSWPTKHYKSKVELNMENGFFAHIGGGLNENAYSVAVGGQAMKSGYEFNSSLIWDSIHIYDIAAEYKLWSKICDIHVKLETWNSEANYELTMKYDITGELLVELKTPFKGWEKTELRCTESNSHPTSLKAVIIFAEGDEYEATLTRTRDGFVFLFSTPNPAIQTIRITQKLYEITMKIQQYDEITYDFRVIILRDGYSLEMIAPYKMNASLIFHTPEEVHLTVVLPSQRIIETIIRRTVQPQTTSVSVNVNVDGRPLTTGVINLIDTSTDQKQEKKSIITLSYEERQIKLKTSYVRSSDGLVLSSLLNLSPKRKPIGVKLTWRNLKRDDVISDIVFYCPTEDIVVKFVKKIPTGRDLSIHAEVASTVNIQSKVAFDLYIGAKDDLLYTEIAITQPQADMRFRLGLPLLASSRHRVYDFRFSSQNKNQQVYFLQSKLNIDQVSNTGDFELSTPHGSTKLRGQLKITADKYVIEVIGNIVAEDNRINATIEIDKSSVLLLSGNARENRWSVSVNNDDWTSLSLNVDHGPKDQLVNDLHASLSLNSSRFLRGIFQWRPGAILQATTDFVQGYFVGKDKINSYVNENLWGAVSDQLRMLNFAISRFTVAILDGYAAELALAHQDMKEVIDENEFLRTTFHFVNQHFGPHWHAWVEFAKDCVSHSTYIIRSTLTDTINSIGELFSYTVSFFDQCILGIESGVKTFAQDPHGTVKFIHRRLLLVMIDIISELKNQLDPLQQKLTVVFTTWIDIFADKFISFLDYSKEYLVAIIRSSKQIPAVSRIFNIIADWLPDETALNRLKTYYHKLVDRYAEAVKKGTALIDKWSKHPFVTSITNYASQAYDKLAWSYNYLEIEKHIVSVWGNIYNRLKESIVDVLQEIMANYSHVSYKAAHVTFNPDKGHVSFTQPLPFEWKSFRHLPTLKIDEEMQHFRAWKEKMWGQYQHLPLDQFLNRVWSKYSLPPLKSHAFLLGYQHYRSFDGRYFEFAGQCSYLLAKDFVNGRFTAVVKYDEEKKRSIFLQIDKTEIEIGPDYTIALNGRKHLLPINGGVIPAMQIGDTIIVGKDGDVVIQCNTVYDLCVFQLPGWYHGKVGGILGNNNNEHFDDNEKPDRNREKNVAEFASSWEVSSHQCTTSINLAVISRGNADAKLCREFLDDVTSPLQSCFRKVDPVPYLQMCANDISDVRQGQQAHVSSIAAYVSECNFNGLSLDMPQSLMHCSVIENNEFSKRKQYHIQSAEISVVVEENKNCNNKFLPELLETIDTTLIARGITDNKFKYIGFNSGELHQNIGEPFEYIKSLGDGNLLQALEYTVNLPFRGDSARIILALPCSDSGSYIDSIDFDTLSEHLRNEKINLHIIADKNYPDKINSFGFNRTHTFIARIGDKVKTQELEDLPHLSAPSSLAIQSNGILVAREYLTTSRLENRKTLFDFFAGALSSTVEPKYCQICQCVSIGGLESRTKCQPCSTK